jgi:hypothetical protein
MRHICFLIMHNISHTTLEYVIIEYYTLLLMPALVTAVSLVLLNFIDLYVKFMIFSPYFNKSNIFPTGVSNISKHKLHENSFQWVPSGCMLADRWTGITKLIVAFFQFCLSA